MAKKRIAYLQHMLDLKRSLTDDEKALRMKLPPHVNKVTEGKPLCLFRKLLEELNFPDMEVRTIMEQGVPLTGIEPESPLYWKKYKPSMVTTEQLDHQAKWRRRAMIGKAMTEDELAQENDLESETLCEVESGFLQGPLDETEISQMVGSEDWSLSKRFVLYQGEDRKIRVIDNYRDSGVNAAFSSSSYIALQDTDFVIGFLRFFMWAPSTIKVPVPKLAPGGRNFVQVGLAISAGGKVTSKTVLKPQEPSTSAFIQVVRKVEDVEVEDDRARRRRHALEGFWKLLSTSLVASAVGLKVSVESTMDTVSECAMKILGATFAVKSPGTLLRRLYSLQAYQQWCSDTFSTNWIPVSERHVWEYVQWLQATHAAPTKASSLLEAMRFAWYLLGVEGADEAEKSLRIKGVSMQMRALKTPWRPADLLTVQEVLTLHKVLGDEGEALGDRLLCGHCLHLLYSPSRWSDLTQVTRAFVDEEQKYFELATKAHKGARSSELKSRLLPIVAPCQGINDQNQNWVVLYLSLRAKAGLALPGADEYKPMMPAPSNDSATSWFRRPLSSQEGADFMRKILQAPKTAERRISTHSFKSTLISWCAKYGLPDTSRAVLARHLSCATATTAVYSRDLFIPCFEGAGHNAAGNEMHSFPT